MKKFLFALALIPITVFSRDVELRIVSKPVPCGDFGSIMARVVGPEWQEIPIWRGGPNEQGNQTVLFYNNVRTTWTIVEYRNNQGCVLGSGMASQLSDSVKIEPNK